jgi:hypothetical protein
MMSRAAKEKPRKVRFIVPLREGAGEKAQDAGTRDSSHDALRTSRHLGRRCCKIFVGLRSKREEGETQGQTESSPFYQWKL